MEILHVYLKGGQVVPVTGVNEETIKKVIGLWHHWVKEEKEPDHITFNDKISVLTSEISAIKGEKYTPTISERQVSAMEEMAEAMKKSQDTGEDWKS